MYAPKETVVEKGGRAVLESLCALCLETFFFPFRMFFQISTDIDLQVIIIVVMSGKRGEDAPCEKQDKLGTIPTEINAAS